MQNIFLPVASQELVIEEAEKKLKKTTTPG